MSLFSPSDLKVETVRHGGPPETPWGPYVLQMTHVPTGTVATSSACCAYSDSILDAYNKLINLLASDEQKALVDAIGVSNADLYFEDSGQQVDNTQDHRVAIAILEGLAEVGWKLVKA